MKFGEIPTEDADGCILAHSLRLPNGLLKKGMILRALDIAMLQDHRVGTVIVACAEPGDVLENEAARRIAEAIAGPHVEIEAAATGRTNMAAAQNGVLLINPEVLISLNGIDEAMTIAALAPYSRVSKGQMIATVKIIPYSVREDNVQTLEKQAVQDEKAISVLPFQEKQVGFILSRLPGDDGKVIAKRRRVTADRIDSLGGRLAVVRECDHSLDAVAQAIVEVAATGCDLMLLFGASAIVDRGDVLPASLEKAGGAIIHLGMPVDPGNLLLLGRFSDVPVVGIPSCAASPKLNGFDWVLERLFAGLPMGRDEIISMAPGGLLIGADVAPKPADRKPV